MKKIFYAALPALAVAAAAHHARGRRDDGDRLAPATRRREAAHLHRPVVVVKSRFACVRRSRSCRQ